MTEMQKMAMAAALHVSLSAGTEKLIPGKGATTGTGQVKYARMGRNHALCVIRRASSLPGRHGSAAMER